MNSYEREAIGNIVIIKNIIFENTTINKNEIDHAYKFGRPCIIIYSDDEYDYLLPIKSSNNNEKYENHYFTINESNVLHRLVNRYSNWNKKKRSKIETKGVINLENVYRVPISGHDEICKVSFETFKNVITELKRYHKKEKIDEIIITAKNIRGR